MDYPTYILEDELTDYMHKAFVDNKDELLHEQNENIEILYAKIERLRRLTEEIDSNVHLGDGSMQKRMDILEKEIVELQSQISEMRAQLIDDETLISQNTQKILENSKAIATLQAMRDSLDELKKKIDQIDAKKAEFSAYMTDKITLHLDYSREENNLFTMIPFNRSVNEYLNSSQKTKEHQKLFKQSLRVAKCVAIAQSFSTSCIDDEYYQYIMLGDDKMSILIKQDQQTHEWTCTINFGGEKTRISLQEANKYGDIVYTMLLEFQKNTDKKTKEANITHVSLMIYGDANLLERAYAQKETEYDTVDVLYSKKIEKTIDMKNFYDMSYKSKSVPLITVLGKGLIPEKEHFITLVHYTSQIYTSILLQTFLYNMDEESKQLREEINSTQYAESNTLANLMLDVNALKANAVRSVVAELSINNDSNINLAMNAILPPFDKKLKTYEEDYPTGDAATWWSKSDPYIGRGRKFSAKYSIDRNTTDSSQGIQMDMSVSDVDGTKDHILNGRMRLYITPNDDVLQHFNSNTGKTKFNYIIHVPMGRDEIASDNVNGDIYNDFRLEPNHANDNATMYYSMLMNGKTPCSLQIKIYPAEALPLTSSIVRGKNLVVLCQGSQVELNTTWSTHVERTGDEERLVIVGDIDASSLFNDKRLGYIAVASHNTVINPSKQTVSVIRKWNMKGTMTSSRPINFTDGSKLYASATITNTDGGHSIAHVLTEDIRIAPTLPAFPLVNPKLLRCKDGDTFINVSERGWTHTDGSNVKIPPQKGLVTIKYLKDPIGIGSVSYVDYALHDVIMKLQNIQNQIADIHDLINDITKRLEFIETSLSSRHSFLTGALSALAMVSTYINPLLGVAVSLLTQIYTVVEMAQHGITTEGVTYVLTNLLDTLLAIKMVTRVPDGWIKSSRKYDIGKATADAQKQVARVKLDKFTYKKKQIDDPGILNTHNVQIMHRPLEEFKYGSYFENILQRISEGTATKKERAIFNVSSKMKLNPTHQFIRTSNVRQTSDGLVKDVWIMGIGDGYSQSVNRSWLGWGNTALIPRKGKAALSPGVFKMSFKRGSDGKWEMLPFRSSGMTELEVLMAGGITQSQALKLMQDVSPEDLNAGVDRTYSNLADLYMYDAKSVVVKDTKMQLMDGQMEALHDSIRKSSYDKYTYSLIGNNCQHFVDSTLTLLERPQVRPIWMSTQQYTDYIKMLDTNFAQYTS